MLGLHRRRRQQLVGGVHGAMLRGRSSLKKRRRGLGGGRAGLLALWLGDGRIWREEGKGGKWWLPSSWTWTWRWEGKPASPGQVWKAGTGGKVTRKAPLPLIYLVSGYTCCTGKRGGCARLWFGAFQLGFSSSSIFSTHPLPHLNQKEEGSQRYGSVSQSVLAMPPTFFTRLNLTMAIWCINVTGAFPIRWSRLACYPALEEGHPAGSQGVKFWMKATSFLG